MDSKHLNPFLWRLFVCLSTLSLSLSIPTTEPTAIPAFNTTVTQLNDSKIEGNNSTNDENIHRLKSENSRENEISNGITEMKFNYSLISETTTQLPSFEFDANNRISGNNPVDQLTELSADQMNTPSLENMFENNVVVSDVSENTIAPMITTNDKNNSHENTFNHSISHENIKSYSNQTNITSNDSMISVPLKNGENVSQTPALTTPPTKKASDGMTTHERHINKRSYFRSSLHSNLDEILNMKRQRRASLRSKRNTNYDDLLASLLAAEEAKYNDNYGSYPDKNELNSLAMNYILSSLNSEDSDNKNSDLDKLSQYYYENLLPLIDSIETGTERASDEENVNRELPIIVQPYSQSVIPVIPYSVSNRYQRIRRSYYDKYRNPISVYTGLKRKKGHQRGEWGRIVGRNNDRSGYEDEAQEANKIYSLATLLATGNTPQEQRLRLKRSLKHSYKPIISLKNM